MKSEEEAAPDEEPKTEGEEKDAPLRWVINLREMKTYSFHNGIAGATVPSPFSRPFLNYRQDYLVSRFAAFVNNA